MQDAGLREDHASCLEGVFAPALAVVRPNVMVEPADWACGNSLWPFSPLAVNRRGGAIMVRCNILIATHHFYCYISKVE
jgi:hypothetical protein